MGAAYLIPAIRIVADVEFWDLNVEIQDYLLSDGHLEKTLAHVERHGRAEIIQKAQLLFELVGNATNNAKRVLRSHANTAQQRQSATRILWYARELVSLAYYPARFNDSDFFFTQDNRIPSLSDIKDKIDDRNVNLFLDVFCDKFSHRFKKGRFDFVGASLAALGQIVPTLSILRSIKQIDGNTKVVLGGPLLPYLEESGALSDEIFSVADHIVIGDGEVPMLRLLNTCEDLPRIISDCPLPSEGEVNLLRSLTPDFDLHPLGRYFSNLFVVPYLFTRRCYWNKCAFCSLSRAPTHVPVKDAKAAVKEMLALRDKYGTHYFMFSDDSLPVSRLRKVCAELMREDVRILWSPLMRFESAITRKDLVKAYEAGCRMIRFGLESGSQTLLDKMGKGTSVAQIEEVLKWCHEIGIFTTCFVFFGFPTETKEDVQITINFIRRNRQKIGYLAYGEYRLERLSDVYHRYQEFNISKIDATNLETCPYVRYTVKENVDKYSYAEIVNMLEEEFGYEAFFGKYLYDTEDFQQFFRTIFDQGAWLIDRAIEGGERARKMDETIDKEGQIECAVENLKTAPIVGNCADKHGAFANCEVWIIHNTYPLWVYPANRSYAKVVEMLLEQEGNVKIADLVATFAGEYGIDNTTARHGVSYVMKDLLKRKCLYAKTACMKGA